MVNPQDIIDQSLQGEAARKEAFQKKFYKAHKDFMALSDNIASIDQTTDEIYRED